MPLLLCARWVLPIAAAPIADGAVLVEGSRIAAIGPRRELSHAHPGAEVHDLPGATALLPGLVDAHVHLCWATTPPVLPGAGFAGWIDSMAIRARGTPPAALTGIARTEADRHLRRGVTAVGDSGPSSGGLAALAGAGLAGLFGVEVFGPDPATATESARAVKDVLDDAAAQAALVAGGSPPARARLALAPHAPYTVSAELLRRAAALAGWRGLPLLIHLAESAEELAFLREAAGPLAERLRRRGIRVDPSGLGPVEWLEAAGALGPRTVLAHGVHLDATGIAGIARAGAGLVLCPGSNAALGVGEAPLRALLEAGVRLGVGTDSAASNPGRDPFQELRLLLGIAARQGAAFGPAEALRLATLGGATVLGLAGELGSLEPGKSADLVALDLEGAGSDEPPEAAAVRLGGSERVRGVWLAGREATGR